jgi:thioredoxin 1
MNSVAPTSSTSAAAVSARDGGAVSPDAGTDDMGGASYHHNGLAANRLRVLTRRAKEPTMASEHLTTITDSNFEHEVLKSSQPVLIDFWATWCGPCRAIAPVVEALAKEYTGKLKVGKIDIDQNPKVPTQYDVRSIPTLLVFKEGKVVGQIVGAVPRPKIEDLIKKAL